MTHYVIAALKGRGKFVGAITDTHPEAPEGGAMLIIITRKNVPITSCETVKPSDVLWIDGSREARKMAAAAKYRVHSEDDSNWNLMQTAILKDRAAAGGRATKGVVSDRKLEAIRKNARLGGRPPEED